MRRSSDMHQNWSAVGFDQHFSFVSLHPDQKARALSACFWLAGLTASSAASGGGSAASEGGSIEDRAICATFGR
jgi:hypothetical protein